MELSLALAHAEWRFGYFARKAGFDQFSGFESVKMASTRPWKKTSAWNSVSKMSLMCLEV